MSGLLERPALGRLAAWAKNNPRDAAAALRECLERSERHNGELRAFISLVPVEDAEWPPASTGPLAGVALAVKDNVDCAGFTTTCGSAFYRHEPARDAPPVARLRAGGATVTGKTNLGEFAIDATCQNAHFGGASNPWDVARTPGGSSGGSAVAVAAGLADIALGTDAGGSVRIPAALCGIVGYRPTGGRWGTAGIAASPWSVDSCGLLARSVDDLVYVLEEAALVAPSRMNDPATVPQQTVGYLSDASMGRCSQAVWEQYGRAIDALSTSGFTMVPLSMPDLTDAAHACAVMGFAEMAFWHRDSLDVHADDYGEGITGPLRLGASFSAVDYLAAQSFRTELATRFDRATAGHELVLTPTVPVTAPIKNVMPTIPGDSEESALFAYIRFTALANVIDLPSVSVPGGLADGLPIGLQLLGRLDRDAELLACARAIDAVMRRELQTGVLLDQITARWA